MRNSDSADNRGTGSTVVGSIQLQDGKVLRIGTDLTSTSLTNPLIIDGQGRFVTPGIVDMHSHSGTDQYPELTGSDDTNDATNPLTPFMRVLDSFDPEDYALQLILEGGVTTSQILPGSANIMGGEAFMIKHKLDVKTIAAMQQLDAPRAMKVSFCENSRSDQVADGNRRESKACLWKPRHHSLGSNGKCLVDAQDLCRCRQGDEGPGHMVLPGPPHGTLPERSEPRFLGCFVERPSSVEHPCL